MASDFLSGNRNGSLAMVNIVPAPSTAKDHLTTHMLSMMHFFLVAGPVPGIDTAHVLDIVLSHNQLEYHSQDVHIPHHPHLLLVRLFRDSRDRMALILVIVEKCQLTLLMVLRYRLVQVMAVLRAWGSVLRTAISLHLIKGQP